MTDNQILTFKISGEEFNKGYNLYHLNKGLSNFHALIDKAYLIKENKSKMTDKDRDKLQIKAFNIREGSFEADLAIHLVGISMSLLPAFPTLSPTELWDLVTRGYNYLKKILELNGQGIDINVNTTGDQYGNIKVNVYNGNGEILIEESPQVTAYASRSQKTFEEISRSINPKRGIDYLTVFDKNNFENSIRVGAEEKVIFENHKRIEPNAIEFKGFITKSNSENFTGKLKVLSTSDELDLGDYNFEFAVKNNPDKLRETYLTEKTFYAYKETSLNAGTLERKVSKLKIIEVAD
ncbi:hypothetical protein [Oceanobacillus aidingensis]|uniref:Uncharacterized protein n=1 Tax=Oceanobacillus aidingensis TaxID=645964 RepID=A0ABV9JVB7_9BACI